MLFEAIGLVIGLLASLVTAVVLVDALVALVVIKVKTIRKKETPTMADRMRKKYGDRKALVTISVSASICACYLFWVFVLGGYSAEDVDLAKSDAYLSGYEAGYYEGFDDGYTSAEDNGIYDPDPEMHRVEYPG